MAARHHRDLAAFSETASTSRVLNLALLDQRHGQEPEHRAHPLFRSRQLNTAIVIKHRLRASERSATAIPRVNATKVVFPFDPANLATGGKSFFVGEQGQEEKLRSAAGITSDELLHDMSVLELLDTLPSLDPFLMREQLRRAGFNAAASYFNISPADLARMQTFVTKEIRRLVALAFGMESGDAAARLADALLSAQLDERLEPLRVTLRLEGDQFREGIFCWRGFLYYKWMRDELTASIVRVVKEIDQIRITGQRDQPSMDYIASTQTKIRNNLRAEIAAAKQVIDDYDRMFDDLVTKSKAAAFREFLLSAPERFVKLGERLGNACHVATSWTQRFPEPGRIVMTLEEALDLIDDFDASLTSATA